MKTITWGFALAISISLAGSPARPATAAPARTVAGHWTWTLKAKCAATPRNPVACREMLVMGLHVYALRATSMTYEGVDHLTVDASGRFTEYGSATFSGTSPGAPTIPLCNPSVMEQQLFRKTCHVTWSGTGHIAEGATVRLDFYTDSGRIIYRNPSITYFEDYTGVGDSLIPAVPGTYKTRRYLNMVGYAKYMKGITVRLTVMHTA